MPASGSPRPSPTRRALLGALGSAVVLSGCGVRLEEDAPDLPLIPRRQPVSGETLLIDLEAETRTLAAVAPAMGGEAGSTLVPMFVAQAQLIRDVLLHGGLPADQLRAPAAAIPDDLGADLLPPARLAAAAIAPVTPPGVLAVVEDAVRPSLVALAAQRYAAATVLTGTEPDLTVDSALWTGTQLPAAAEGIYLALLDGGYLFEIVAAQVDGDRRAAALAAADAFRRRAAWLPSVLPKVPSPPMGAPLPEPITDDASVDRVAQSAASTVITRIASILPTMTAGGQSSANLGMNRADALLGPTLVTGLAWGMPLTAFPGLT